MLILYFIYERLIVFITEKFRFLQNLMTFLPIQEVFRTLAPVAVILGIGIGFIGSALTIRKHLNV